MDIRRLEQLARMGDQQALAELQRYRERRGDYPHFTTISVCVEQAQLLSDLFKQGHISFVDYIESVFQICVAKRGQVLQLESMVFKWRWWGQYGRMRMERILLAMKSLFPVSQDQKTQDWICKVTKGPKGQPLALTANKLKAIVSTGSYIDAHSEEFEPVSVASDPLEYFDELPSIRPGHKRLIPEPTPTRTPSYEVTHEGRPRISRKLGAHVSSLQLDCYFPWRCGISFYFHILSSEREMYQRNRTSRLLSRYARGPLGSLPTRIHPELQKASERSSATLISSKDIRGGWALQPDGTWRKLGAR